MAVSAGDEVLPGASLASAAFAKGVRAAAAARISGIGPPSAAATVHGVSTGAVTPMGSA
jgi:hypothetical protein